jgi:hypothetical protein
MHELDAFQQFQLAEYQKIAEAFFALVNQVSSFFQYYLLTISAPMVIVYILKESNVPIKDLIVKDDNKIYREIFFALLLVLSVVGLIISIFIINLRLDSVLYARTVNGVRNYFYNCSHLSTAQINQIKVLPVNIKVPSYFEWMIFLPIVSAFALINSSYMLLSFFILKKGKLGAWLIIISVLFLILHLVIYYLLCYYRENAYLIQ